MALNSGRASSSQSQVIDLRASRGNSLQVLWLVLCVFTAKGSSSTLGGETKISQAPQCGQKKKKREGGLQGIVNVQMMGDGYHETPNSGEDGLFTELSSQDGISHWDRETR